MDWRNEPIFNIAARCTTALNVDKNFWLIHVRVVSFPTKEIDLDFLLRICTASLKKYTQEILNKICFYSAIHLIFYDFIPRRGVIYGEVFFWIDLFSKPRWHFKNQHFWINSRKNNRVNKTFYTEDCILSCPCHNCCMRLQTRVMF